MPRVNHDITRFAVWNWLATASFPTVIATGIAPNGAKARNQVPGLANLDADFVTLVEIFPSDHITHLAAALRSKGLDCSITFREQPHSHLGIGFLHKPGIKVTNPRFVPGSEGAYVRGSLTLFPMSWTMKMGRARFRTQVSDRLPFTASFRLL